jgi:hypothetical protein
MADWLAKIATDQPTYFVNDKQRLINSRTKFTDWIIDSRIRNWRWNKPEHVITNDPKTTYAVTIHYFVYHCVSSFKCYEEIWIVNLFSCEELITVLRPNLIFTTTLAKCFWLFVRHVHGCHLFLEAVLFTRNLRTHRTIQTKISQTQISIPGVGFEPTIPWFEREKTVHALHRAAAVIGIYATSST